MFKPKVASKLSVTMGSIRPGEVPKEFDPEQAVDRLQARPECMHASLGEPSGSEMDRRVHMEEG